MTAAPQPLNPGFADPVTAAQAVFRGLLDAISHPGRIVVLEETVPAPEPLEPATAAVALTLFDFETPLWLDTAKEPSERLKSYFAFHTGAPVTANQARAAFAIVTDIAKAPPLNQFALGSPENPERSTTLLVQVPDLHEGRGIRLTGPGIESARYLDIEGLPQTVWQQRRDLKYVFPQGIDIVFTCRDRLAAVPRSTHVEI
ncbi:MAG: phosphonate C-P lyase system protein PhnH [Rhodospirillales bacterium]